MGQARRTDHQRCRDAEHIERAFAAAGVGRKAQLPVESVEPIQQKGVGARQRAAEAQLGHGVAGELQGDEDGGHHKGKDQHAVLRHLGVGDALHAAQHRVEKHNRHADHHPPVDIDLQKAREHHAHAPHLPGHVGERHEQGAHHRHRTGQPRVVAVADEVGHGELTELAQVGSQQQGQQHVAARPAHQVYRAVVAHEGDQPGHRDKRSGRHPIGGGGQSVGQRMHAPARHVEVLGRTGPRPDGNADVQGKGDTDENVGPGLYGHEMIQVGGQILDDFQSGKMLDDLLNG